ncbi:tetratricopeptide repeat protein, partial [Halobacterium salinarum]
MVEEFKHDIYSEQERDSSLNEWANQYESEHREDESEYGFWFAEAYPNLTARREKISQFVEGADPPLGQMILASMLQQGVVSHVFTPNFDDLLVNASIDLPGRRPLFVDHDARASRIQFPSDRPAIMKVHGDFLHYTKNTDEETSSLNEPIEQAFKKSLQSWGLVVLGYAGWDESIMGVLEETEVSEKGLYWCKLSGHNVNDRVEKLLESKDNAYLVEIEGSEEFFTKILNRSTEDYLPNPEEFVEKAKNTADRIRDLLRNQENVSKRHFLEAMSEDRDYSGEIPDSVDETDELSEVVNLIEKDKNKSAIETLNSIIESTGNPHFAYYYRGLARQSIGEDEKAIRDFDTAIELDTEFTDAYRGRGISKRRIGRHSEALEDLNEAIKLDSEHSATYVGRGRVKRELGELEAAIEDLNEAIKLDPEHSATYVNRGILKRELGELEAAIEDYNEAINLGTEHFAAYFNRGNARKELGELEAAIEDYNEAIKLDPEDSAAYFNRGNARKELGELEAAIEDYNEAIKLDPEDSAAYFNRGSIKRELGELEAAIEDLNEAIKLDPEHSRAYVNRGSLKQELGELEAAIEDYNEAINLSTEHFAAYFNRGS